MKKCKMLFSILLLQSGLIIAQVKTPEQQKKTSPTQQKQKNDKMNQQKQKNDKTGQQKENPDEQTQMNDDDKQTQVYDDFEGNKSLTYISKSGTLDTAAANPMTNNINNSARCAKYTRNMAEKFDNIKMALSGTLSNVDAYATYNGVPKKIKMKVYSTAPVGTLIEIHLGKRENSAYPQGTNSQYQTYTTKRNTWEEVEFKFSVTPDGSETNNKDINQITLLFSPNSNSSDTYYFDDITGPMLNQSQPIGSRK